jgi:hypothetical protein
MSTRRKFRQFRLSNEKSYYCPRDIETPKLKTPERRLNLSLLGNMFPTS